MATIRKRNNSYQIAVSCGYDINGKQICRYMTYVDMEFVVTFWDREGALSANRLILLFGKHELEKLLLYLQLVTGLISEDDEMITKLFSEGSLYG